MLIYYLNRDFEEPTSLSEESLAELKLMQQLEANHVLTILYLIIEVGRTSDDLALRKAFKEAISKFCDAELV